MCMAAQPQECSGVGRTFEQGASYGLGEVVVGVVLVHIFGKWRNVAQQYHGGAFAVCLVEGAAQCGGDILPFIGGASAEEQGVERYECAASRQAVYREVGAECVAVFFETPGAARLGYVVVTRGMTTRSGRSEFTFFISVVKAARSSSKPPGPNPSWGSARCAIRSV